MRSFKHVLFVLLLLPLISFADAMDATYKNISPACYRTFKTIFSMLPDLAGSYGYGISNLKTPSANPSTYTFSVDYSPSGLGIGNYGLYQKYSNNNTLYLRLDAYPSTFPLDQSDKVWETIGQLLKACPLVE